MAGQRYSRDEEQLHPFFKGFTALFGNEVSPFPVPLALAYSVNQVDLDGGKYLTCRYE